MVRPPDVTTDESARPGDDSGTGQNQTGESDTARVPRRRDESPMRRITRIRRAAEELDLHLGLWRPRHPEPYTTAENGTALGVPEREAAAPAPELVA